MRQGEHLRRYRFIMKRSHGQIQKGSTVIVTNNMGKNGRRARRTYVEICDQYGNVEIIDALIHLGKRIK